MPVRGLTVQIWLICGGTGCAWRLVLARVYSGVLGGEQGGDHGLCREAAVAFR